MNFHIADTDYREEYVASANNTETQMSYAWDEFLVQSGKRGEVDIMSWMMLGNVFVKNGLVEYGFQCYYMAYLKDPTLIPTNSKLKLESLSSANLDMTQKPDSLDEIFKLIMD